MQARRKSGTKTTRKAARTAARGAAKKKAPRGAARFRARPTTRKAARKAARKPITKKPVAKKPAARKPVARRAGSKKSRRTPAQARATLPAPRHPLGFLELHISFNTRAYEGLVSFFRDQVGLPLQPMEEMGYINVDVCRGGSLGFMRWSPPESAEGGEPAAFEPSEAGVYVMCEDIAFVYRTLTERGVHFEGPPADQPWGHRTIRTTDPEGRSLVFAQAMGV